MPPPKTPEPAMTKDEGLAEVLKRIVKPESTGLFTADNDAQHVIVPKSHDLLKVPFDRPHPIRKAAKVFFRLVEDFIAYVNEQKDADTTRIFYTDTGPANPRFTAVMDYHGTAGKDANYSQHKALLELALSEQAALWFALDGKWIDQITFAEFIQNNASDVMSPSASEMIKIALELEGSTKGSFSSVNDLHNGNVKIQCVAETTTTIVVPREIQLYIPVFGDTKDVSVNALFRFRVDGSQPRFCLRFPELARLRRKAVEKARETIADKTGLPVYAAEIQ